MKRLFNGKDVRLCVDSHGFHEYARTVKELREKVGGGAVHKLYADRKSGGTYHVGYAVGGRWFRIFQQLEVEASV